MFDHSGKSLYVARTISGGTKCVANLMRRQTSEQFTYPARVRARNLPADPCELHSAEVTSWTDRDVDRGPPGCIEIDEFGSDLPDELRAVVFLQVSFGLNHRPI